MVFTWDPKWNLPELKFQPPTKEILFNCGRNEIKFRFGGGPRNTTHSERANHSCFDEVNAYAEISFPMISFRVVFTWHFVTQNKISFLSIWPQWNNTRNKFHIVLYHVISYNKLSRDQNENILCRLK